LSSAIHITTNMRHTLDKIMDILEKNTEIVIRFFIVKLSYVFFSALINDELTSLYIHPIIYYEYGVQKVHFYHSESQEDNCKLVINELMVSI